MLRLQNSLETLILIAVVIAVFVAVFLFFFLYLNNSGIKYVSSPYILNNLKFSNFASEPSTCSFDFSYSLNEYNLGNQSSLYFILNNGVKIIPEYKDYSVKVSEPTTGLYSYSYIQTMPTSYNSSVCTSIAQSSEKGYYVEYIEREISSGVYVVQPTGSDYVFSVNGQSTNPSTLYGNNTVYLDASSITDAGVVSIANQSGNYIQNSPFAFGEYVYLPTGNYTISYSNESNPVNFMYWNYSGGIIVSNPFSSTSNVVVVNGGTIFANLRNLLAVTKYFEIYSNKSEALENTKVNISVVPPVESGFYTFYVNNQPYSSCVHITSGSCVISESAGTYTITSTFENKTKYETSYPLEFSFYKLPYVLLDGAFYASNNTLKLVANVVGGYGATTYSFYYGNGTEIENCQNTQSPTCSFVNNIKPSNVSIKVYNPSTASLDGSNGAQIELQPNLASLGIQSPIGYDRFFEGSNELYAWCENNCTSGIANVWVNIPNGINGGQTLTLNLSGSKSITEKYVVKASNAGGMAENSTNINAETSNYSYFSNHMGYYGKNNDIGFVMNSGLLYQIWGWGGSGVQSQSELYQATMLPGSSFTFGGTTATASSTFYNTPLVGTTQNVNGNNQNNVMINYQNGYSGGSPPPNPPVSNNNYWLVKAIGFVNYTAGTQIYGIADDAIGLGYSTTSKTFSSWLGGTSNPNNIINEWKPEGATIYSGTIPNSGDYAIELDFENQGGPGYIGMWSNNPLRYYSPTPYPNNQAPIITYETSPPLTYNPDTNLTIVNNEYVEQNDGFSWMNNPTQQFTISIWVNSSAQNGVIVDELGQTAVNTNWHDSWIELVNGNVYIRVWNLGCVNLGSIPIDSWSNIVMTGSVSGSTLTYSGYINGVFKASGSGGRSTPGGSSEMYYPLGSGDSTNCGSGAYFNGEMANYQFYNNVVSPSSIYSAGINGRPPTTSGLELWYPLNGTTTDYSGNNNNGQII